MYMKKIFRLFAIFIIIASSLVPTATNASEKTYTESEKRHIFSQMFSAYFSAVTTAADAPLYADKTEKSVIIYSLPENHFVQIHEDFSQDWLYVSDIFSSRKGWTKRENLEVLKETPLKTDVVNNFCLEGFVNLLKIESKNKYLVFCDVLRQKTHIFYGGTGDWTLIKSFPCSTGKNESPTIKGLYAIKERGDWFYSERLGSGAKYWMRFNDAYLFHSQAMDRNKELLTSDNEIGKPVSSGCVRLYEKDAEWLYRNVPDGAAVFIH